MPPPCDGKTFIKTPERARKLGVLIHALRRLGSCSNKQQSSKPRNQRPRLMPDATAISNDIVQDVNGISMAALGRGPQLWIRSRKQTHQADAFPWVRLKETLLSNYCSTLLSRISSHFISHLVQKPNVSLNTQYSILTTPSTFCSSAIYTFIDPARPWSVVSTLHPTSSSLLCLSQLLDRILQCFLSARTLSLSSRLILICLVSLGESFEHRSFRGVPYLGRLGRARGLSVRWHDGKIGRAGGKARIGGRSVVI